MMRIAEGRLKGLVLTAPRGRETRPTSDKVREALFNILFHSDLLDGGLNGKRVVDLFAGTGALGLEALSRGAAYCLFVEEAVEARGALRRNIEAAQAMGQTKIFRRDATKLGRLPARAFGPFDLVFCDPPYGKGLGQKALCSALANNWLAPGALVVFEMRADEQDPEIEGLSFLQARTWGDTKVGFLRLK